MVVILLGSKSDLSWASEIAKYLKEFGIDSKLHVASAHKTPDYLLQLIKSFEKSAKGKVYICVAGRSNALGGIVDAQTRYPVINCPPYSEKYGGLDILSSLRMPSGVAPLTVLEPEQAALATAKIFALSDKKMRAKLAAYQERIKKKVRNSKL